MPTVKSGIIDRKQQGEFVSSLIRQLKFKREDFRTVGSIGGFTALIDLGNFAVSFNNDGVGTKVLIAEETGRWDTMGIDCIAMNVNDAITVGAEPIAMVDYIALNEANSEVARQIGTGFNVGAQISNITIVGGETSIVPDLVKGIDISGAVLGIVQKSQIVNGENIKPGDLIFSLQSSGLHSNGFTTVRHILGENSISMDEQFPGDNKKTADVLLEPTRIYVREILDILNIVNIHGMANITGGGFKNLPRMKDMHYVIEDPVDPPNVFKQLMSLGGLSYDKMYETFNMGTGYVVIIDPESRLDFINTLKSRVSIKEIGHVEAGTGISIPKFSVELAEYY
ncbi:MAG: phosphoribosylformylglycinamidine cyclo-ligase [Thermoplasmataceae archaeon]